MPPETTVRERVDRCPGVTRPWPAEDGALVRLRLVGGRLPTSSLRSLLALSEAHGDGDLHLTARANLQVRGLPDPLPDAFVAGVEAAGLLPSRAHDLVRNVMLSPLSGTLGGRADLRPVAAGLDRLLLASDDLARLPGRFLFVLDDGRGDLVGRTSDLAVVAVSPSHAQVRAGSTWGPVVVLEDAAETLAGLAKRFLDVRGDGPTAAWHVDELGAPLLPACDPDPGLPEASARPSYPEVEEVDVPDGRMTPALTAAVLARAGDEVVVTPWHSVLLPRTEPS